MVAIVERKNNVHINHAENRFSSLKEFSSLKYDAGFSEE
jgi:hypothetical protein